MKRLIISIMLISCMCSLLANSLEVDESLALKICDSHYTFEGKVDSVLKFEKRVLSYLEIDYEVPGRAKIISDFFNTNSSSIICQDDLSEKIWGKEHLFKRSIARGDYYFLEHVANDDNYSINFNIYEYTPDGSKETLLDYIDLIINDDSLASEYDIDELELLVEVLEERGAKRAIEL